MIIYINDYAAVCTNDFKNLNIMYIRKESKSKKTAHKLLNNLHISFK